MAVYELNGVAPQIHPSVFVAPSADVVGNVTLEKGASVWFNTVIRGDVNAIRIGADTNIQDGTVIHGTYQKWSVNIGRGVSIGHSAMIHGCTIGDYCLIGMQATILDGAEIGSECLVGAGALVTGGSQFPPRSLILGAPAKRVRELTDAEVKSLYDSVDRYKMYTTWYATEGGGFKKC
jgi:carbonic anhydrase/acetyltransferase-like protein (isoleucine patch superfamily)